MLIAGEVGVGKSRLVHEFALGARSRGVRVLEGSCLAFAGEALPYVALVDVLRQLPALVDTAALSRLLGDDRIELSRLVPELSRLAASSPGVAVVVEDVHWASPAGLELFNYLLHATPERLGIVATYRSDELPARHPLRPLLAEARRLDRVEHIELSRLSLGDVTAMVAAISGSEPDAGWAAQVFAESDGIPFFVEELVASTARDGHGMPHRLHDLLTPRLLRLTALGRNVVRVAAVAGRQVDHDVLHAVADLPDDRLDAGLRNALDEQVLVLTPDGRGYEFRHALMREAVYSQLLPGERSRAHGRYAQRLVADDPLGGTGSVARVAEIAQHYSAAGDKEASLVWALWAGRAGGEVYAFAEALRQYQRALTLWSRVPDAATISGTSRRALLGDAIRVADLTGNYGVGLQLIEEALAATDLDSDPIAVGVLHERRGWYLSMSGKSFGPAMDACRKALVCVPVAPPSPERARALATYGWLLAVCGLSSQAVRLCDEALAIARALGAEQEVARAQAGRGAALPLLGDPEAGMAAGREACEISERLGLLETLGLAHVLLTLARLYFDRRLEDVLDDVLSACELLCRLGLDRQSPAFLLSQAAFVLCELARWDQAADRARQSRAMTEFDMAPVTEIHLARVDIARGDLDQARARLEQPPNLMTVGPIITRLHIEYLAELQIWQGRSDDALSMVRAGLGHLHELGQVMFSGRLLVLGMRACADSADRARAARTDATLMRSLDVAGELRAWVSRAQPDPLDPHVTRVATTEADAATWAAEGSRLHGRSDPELWQTVGVHVSHILHKLDVHDRVEAATRAHRLGLVD